MNFSIELHDYNGFQWKRIPFDTHTVIYTKGYFYFRGILYKQEKIASFFEKLPFKKLKTILAECNGIFTIIIQRENQVILINDIIRTFPLFFTQYQDQWIISDDANKLADKCGYNKINDLGYNQFLSAGFTMGNETLLKNIVQTKAGEMVVLNNSTFFTIEYFTLATKMIDDEHISMKEAKDNLKNVLLGTFERSIQAVSQNRYFIVPLSGGYDSRLIAAALKMLNVHNVHCFTYSMKQDRLERDISEAVAKKLGFNWHYVEFTTDMFQNLVQKDDFQRYYRYGSQLSSLFYIQEYLATREFKKRELVPDNAVFLPGFSGDFIAGSHLFLKNGNLKFNNSNNEIAQAIFNEKCDLNPLNKNKENTIKQFIKGQLDHPECHAYTIFDDWEMRERQSKFITNSSRIFTYFGYSHLLPFWDIEFVNYFKHLPYSLRLYQQLYNYTLENEFFKPLGISFKKDALQPSVSTIKKQRIKNNLKRKLPLHIRKHLTKRKKNIFHKTITKPLLDDLNLKSNHYLHYTTSKNAIYIYWYLKKHVDRFQSDKDSIS